MSKESLTMLRRKHNLWKRYQQTKSFQDFEEYKRQEKKTQKEIRRSKRKFERKLSRAKGKGNRLFNSYIRSKTKSRSTIGPLKNKEGVSITDDYGMAEILNDFFASVFTDESSGAVPQMASLLSESCISLVNIEESMVCDKIKKLKPSCAPGPDKISAQLLQLADKEISRPLAIIFRRSLAEGKVPDDWRSANITPINKKVVKDNAGNYRPVSLTSLPCKLMESIIRDAIMDHLLENNRFFNHNMDLWGKNPVPQTCLNFLKQSHQTLPRACLWI